MKLYLQDDEIIFDYSDVDFKNKDNKTYQQYFDFTHKLHSELEFTLRKQVKRLVYDKLSWFTEYDNLLSKISAIADCCYAAQYCSLIEISDDIKPYLDQLREQCEEMKEAKLLKEQRERAEAEAKALWKDRCRNGCLKCKNCRKWEDDFVCAATGAWLEEKLYTGYIGITHVSNMPVPFPTDNCPLNINNLKEEAV